MKTIIISPWSRPLRNGKENPKNYPYWEQLVPLIKSKGYRVIQIGRSGEKVISSSDEVKWDLSLDALKELTLSVDTWMGVDNFYQHFCNLICKKGYVIFGASDPKIFGYPQNVNLLKSRTYLREKQFDIWEVIDCDNSRFLNPSEIMRLASL